MFLSICGILRGHVSAKTGSAPVSPRSFPRFLGSSVLLIPLALTCGALNPRVAAAWSSDPNSNDAVVTATGDQSAVQILGDGSGGSIMAWQDSRNGSNLDIYAQRFNAAGVAQWATNGVALCTATGDQSVPFLTSDGSGGAIVTFQDARNGNNDIYVQRVSNAGATLWTANGIVICTATGDQTSPRITTDGLSGAIITWSDTRSVTSNDIYAQRVDSGATTQWAANGIAVCVAANNQEDALITSNGSGGAIITWQDSRSFSYDIYAQALNSSGTPQWTANGVALCTATGNQLLPHMCSDNAGGAIVAWQDLRSGTTEDIYTQRINNLGVVQWTADGVALCTATDTQLRPQATSDGASGAIVAWQDLRSGVAEDIYAQRVNNLGAVQWTADGVAVCTATNTQAYSQIISDGSAGALVSWVDLRNGVDYDGYIQRVNGSGVAQWTANGVAISTATSFQLQPVMTSDGSGGATITWDDLRAGSFDVYASHVSGGGVLPVALTHFALE